MTAFYQSERADHAREYHGGGLQEKKVCVNCLKSHTWLGKQGAGKYCLKEMGEGWERSPGVRVRREKVSFWRVNQKGSKIWDKGGGEKRMGNAIRGNWNTRSNIIKTAFREPGQCYS